MRLRQCPHYNHLNNDRGNHNRPSRFTLTIPPMKKLILACLFTVSLLSFTGCASDERHTTTTESSATLSADSKDMHHRGQ